MTGRTPPVVEAIAATSSGARLLVVFACPFCDGRHVHGGGEKFGGGNGHRSPHCREVECRDCGERHVGGVPKGGRGRCTVATKARGARSVGGYIVHEVEP